MPLRVHEDTTGDTYVAFFFEVVKENRHLEIFFLPQEPSITEVFLESIINKLHPKKNNHGKNFKALS